MDCSRRQLLSSSSVAVSTALAGCLSGRVPFGRGNEERHNVTIVNGYQTNTFSVKMWDSSKSLLVDASRSISADRVWNFVVSGSPSRVAITVDGKTESRRWRTTLKREQCNERNPTALVVTHGAHGDLFVHFTCESIYERTPINR